MAASTLSAIAPQEKQPQRPTDRLFWSPQGLYPFQVEDTAQVFWQLTESEAAGLVLWDTGTGKTVISLALMAMLIEDGLVDHVVVVAEAKKMSDWIQDDIPRFTTFDAKAYAGSVDKRRRMLKDLPQVLVMSYETGRNDLCKFAPKRKAITGDGMLTEALRGKRVLIVFDEFSRLRSRTSRLYLAWDYLVNRVLRRSEHPPKVIGLTATSVENNPEDHWNAGRVLAPWRAGNVDWFYRTYVKAYDVFENPADWKNLTTDDCEEGVTPLSRLFGPITVRRRKDQPEVMQHFPAKVENAPKMVDLHPWHANLYHNVEDLLRQASLDVFEEKQTFGLMRLLAAHPLAATRSKGRWAQDIVAQIGHEALAEMEAAKVEAMLRWQEQMAEQQTVIFTFYGNTVLPLLQHHLERAGYQVSINHGGLSPEEAKRSQDAYKAGDTQIFLSSDAGAKGLNLGVGSGLLHYEMPLLYSTYDQRSNRIHRIDSLHPSVTIDALIARDTVEEPIARVMLKRNRWADQVLDDDMLNEDEDPAEGFLRANDRTAMFNRVA